MTRSFDGTAVDETWLDGLCATALWAPTAGNSAGVRFYTLGPSYLDTYLEIATDAEWRERSRRYEGLRRAGGLVLVTARVSEYLQRYGEVDKAESSLSEESAWPLPYWHTDAAMATMALLLLLEEGGWQAALWGNFRHGDAVLKWLDIRDEELFATVFIGRSDGNDPPSASLARPIPSRQARVKRVTPRTETPS
jgi:nitroreductase